MPWYESASTVICALGSTDLQAPDVAPRVPGDGDAGRPRRESFRSNPAPVPCNGSEPLYPLGCMKTLAALPRNPLDDVVRRNFRKQERALPSPDRPFRPLIETGCHLLKHGIGRDELIDSRVDSLNLLGEDYDGSR